ncbi:probable ubiquitin-conjugating enzyme E2 23 isoform X2 [Cucumis sativus]|nr:probable ubiquitin-conjugating enzyme E2 23 isoform X2 [Cucumis sativus]
MEQQDSVDKESLIGTCNNRDGVSSSDIQITTINNDEARIKNENTSDKPNIPHIYRQDIVKSKGSGMIGIVTEVAGDADSDSDITDDEDEDDDGEDGGNDDECDDNDGDGEKEGQNKENCGDDGNGRHSNGDNYKSQPLPDNEVRVLWMDESETTQHVNDLTVIDRGFVHGDFVAAVSDPTGQAGVVVDVNISVDLLVPDGSIMKDISSKDLKRVRDFTVGDYVVLGPWLGRVDDVLDNVTVMFDDGSKCKVTKAEPLRLKPVSKNTLEDANFPYYPGQRVRATSTVFKNSKWLSGLWKPNRLEGTVTKVTVGSVFIYWIASAGYGPDSSTAPAEEQTPKNLRLLTCFSHANWQLGDWCLLPPSFSAGLTKDPSQTELSVTNTLDCAQSVGACDSEDTVLDELSGTTESTDLDSISACDGNYRNPVDNSLPESSSSRALKETAHETWPLHRKKIRKVVVRRDKKARKKEENFERALLIINTKTRVDVAWQDGQTELGLDSTSLIPIDNPGDHEFVPEQYVVEKASDNDDDVSESRRVGVVKSVHAKERTACVRWLKPVSRAEDPREFDKEEIVSVYELEGHPDYDYCYGDVVVRLSPVSDSAEAMSLGINTEELKQQSSTNEMMSCTEFNNASGSQKIEDTSCSDDCIDFSDLSWVGNITGLKNGDIEVTWANGMVSTVGPQAIYVVGRDDDDESIAAGSEVSNGAASWETVDNDEMDSVENAAEDIELQDTGANSEEEESEQSNSGRNLALSVPLAALRFVTRLAAGIFSRGPRNPDSMDLDSHSESEIQSLDIQASEGKDSGLQSTSLKSNSFDASDMNSDCGRGEDGVASEPSEVLESAKTSSNLRTVELDASACHEDGTCSFKGFDIAKDPLDHYFLGTNGQTNNGRKWLKKIQQDWSILQNNLPDGIYVRVYEDRMDLLRAVIVGAYGTPYQDGLFFFDFHLPPEYPDVPPSAYYHSGGWRINPNLYEEGKVCLSLLNTWTGRGNEVWDPKSSSILQVLVSLQGLVLNSKPYFNEAGYDKQVGTAEGEKNSLSYNENTFLLNCKTIMYLMRKPPKDFEELIKEHFRRRGYFILKACDAYMKGHLIGSLTEDASVRVESDPNSTSVGFKLMLAKIVPKLFSSLNEVGADCQDFKHFQQL